MQGQVIGIATLQITGGQSVNFAIPSERISQLTIAAPMSLSDLVVASGRNKRAKAVQFFRDGLSFLSKDDCEKAIVAFEKAVESDSNYAEAWAQSGFCHEKLGKHAEALEASKKAVSLRPSAESYFNIGLANFYLKQYKDAVDEYRLALAGRPGDDTIKRGLDRARKKAGAGKSSHAHGKARVAKAAEAPAEADDDASKTPASAPPEATADEQK
jgi:tetratricopeptide (TPR) repeat protein